MPEMTDQEKFYKAIQDPIKFARVFWPWVTFYPKQREILYSVRDNFETVVPAANMVARPLR